MSPVSDVAKKTPFQETTRTWPSALDQGFYNQWARLPRVKESNHKVFCALLTSPVSIREDTTGNLKSARMTAIFSDKQRAMEASPRDKNNYLEMESVAVPSDGVLSPGHRCSTSSGLSGQRGQGFPPILDLTKQNELGTAIIKDFLAVELVNLYPEDTGSSVTNRNVSLNTTSAEKQEFSGFPACQKSRPAAVAEIQEAQFERQPQLLPLRKACFLFPEEMDKRDEHYMKFFRKRSVSKTVPQRLPRNNKRQPPVKATGETSSINIKGRDESCKGGTLSGKTVNVKRVQLIDLIEVKNTLIRRKEPLTSNESKGNVLSLNSWANKGMQPSACCPVKLNSHRKVHSGSIIAVGVSFRKLSK